MTANRWALEATRPRTTTLHQRDGTDDDTDADDADKGAEWLHIVLEPGSLLRSWKTVE
jgi:hypothetical protein